MESLNTQSLSDDLLAARFYGPAIRTSNRNWNESILHVRKTYKEFQFKPVPSVFKSRLDGPSASWKIFKRLSLAASFADSSTKDCMIFSFEERNADHSGQRLFLVTHPHHLWLNYKSRPPDERCTYEVIRENFPCKLYFDLEFSRLLNPTKNGNDMTKIFIQCVISKMLNEYGIQLRSSNFLWLDASTDLKFSSHLILQIPDAAFQNNVVAGSFVSLLLHEIMSRITSNAVSSGLWPSSSELKSLIVLKAEEKKSFFCDTSVYTKNRNFRLYLSTKYGKRSPLIVSEYNQYKPAEDGSRKELEELIFYDSLITYFRNNNKNMRILGSSNSLVSKALNENGSLNSKSNNFGLLNTGSSPFPEIDGFILSQVRDDQSTGFIRKWSYIEAEDFLIYEIGNYRFCSNIGRHHKSNNIMLIVDLKKKHYYQKCHDPDCKAENYKSPAKHLPSSLYLPEDFFETECFSQLITEPIESLLNSENKENTLKIEDSNDIIVEDSFFEDCFPFTQVNTHADRVSVSGEIPIQAQSSDDADALLFDINLDDILSEDFETDTMTETTNFKAVVNEDKSSNNAEENSFREGRASSSPDFLSTQDEIIMADAAAVLEFSFTDGDIMSEETIF